MNFDDYLKHKRAGKTLNRSESRQFMDLLVDDASLTDEKVTKALIQLTPKAVSVDEICGFIDSIRSHMLAVTDVASAIDNCGTGGDKSGTFNISTASAILLAAGNVKVAKHGNRAASSKCGSADVLETLGIPIDLDPDAAARSMVTHNFAFLFAQIYHPAMKRLAIIRRNLGFPTVFNLLGPMLNPASVHRQVIGTFNLANAELLTKAISHMNYQHVIVLNSDDGLDEASLTAPVQAFEIKRKSITRLTLRASDYGLKPASAAELIGGDATKNAHIITSALQPSKILNAHQRIIVFNAGLGFYVANQVKTIEAGVRRAAEVLKSGEAYERLEELRTNS